MHSKKLIPVSLLNLEQSKLQPLSTLMCSIFWYFQNLIISNGWKVIFFAKENPSHFKIFSTPTCFFYMSKKSMQDINLYYFFFKTTLNCPPPAIFTFVFRARERCINICTIWQIQKPEFQSYPKKCRWLVKHHLDILSWVLHPKIQICLCPCRIQSWISQKLKVVLKIQK